MTCQPSWIRGGGVVAHLHPEDQDWQLPDEAVPLETFHITLIGRKSFLGKEDAMAAVWAEVASTLPEPPRAELASEVHQQAEDDRLTWFLHLVNQEDFTDYVEQLTNILDVAFQKKSGIRFENPENARYFHMTIGNNQGGDPMKSIGSIRQPERA